jgi:hypothetical protein
VEKESFIEVLKHYSESSEEEALKVLSLKESYPYSQLLHTLSARVSKDHEFINHQKELQLAAIYAADRSVLKDVMTLDNLVAIRPNPPIKPSVQRVVPPPPVTPQRAAVVDVTETDTGSLADQVMSDLEKLHELKHNFEMMFSDSGQISSEPVEKASKKTESVETTEANDNTDTYTSRESSKSRKARIVELAKAMAAARDGAPVEEPKPKLKKKRDLPGDNYLDEIATTKKELEPENEKQKEQLEIIEQFIKTQPSITSPKDKQAPTTPGDLSSIKTGEFNDNVVSETLVEILIKQGKKDKAIEVLKKLIWKFPQKKAYFAAQIEELKSS